MAANVPPARRMTTAARTAYTPGAGALIFDTTLGTLWQGDGSTAGGVAIDLANLAIASPSSQRSRLGLPDTAGLTQVQRERMPIGTRPMHLTSFRNPGAANVGYSYRTVHTLPRGATSIQFEFGNTRTGNSPTLNGELPSGATVRLKASLEYPINAYGVTAAANSLTPIYFNGSRTVDIGTGAIVRCDPVFVGDLPVGAQIGVRTYPVIPGWTSSSDVVPLGQFCDLVSEGFATSGDVTDSGIIGITSGVIAVYGPSAIIGRTKAAGPSVGVLGDSIQYGFRDTPNIRNQGPALRALNDQFPVIFGPQTGEAASDFVLQYKSARRRLLASACTNLLVNFGANDLVNIAALTGDIPTLKANILAITNDFTARGVRVTWATLIPKGISTDGWRTVASQLPYSSQEANRLTMNAWFRLASGSGYVASCASPSMVSVVDYADAVEVNASNVLARNGGFWICPTTDLVTGTATGGTATTLTDSTKAWTTNQYAAANQYMVGITAGTASGQYAIITANTATQLTFAALSGAGTPDSTSQYRIFLPYSIDGTHPTGPGNILMAAKINTGTIVLS